MKTSVFVLKTSFSDLRKNLNLKNLNMIISRLIYISVFLKFGKNVFIIAQIQAFFEDAP